MTMLKVCANDLVNQWLSLQVCQELLRIFDTAGFKDAAGEAWEWRSVAGRHLSIPLSTNGSYTVLSSSWLTVLGFLFSGETAVPDPASVV